MYSSGEKYEVVLKSVTDINMSNWQITKTLDTMTMVNNKFVILSIINNLINEGIDKKDIFVTDKSFLISTNYKTYFENGNEFWGKQKDIVKMYSLGRLISMEPNEDIFKMNCLFEFYKKQFRFQRSFHRCGIYLQPRLSAGSHPPDARKVATRRIRIPNCRSAICRTVQR